MRTNRDSVLMWVSAERDKQDAKFPGQWAEFSRSFGFPRTWDTHRMAAYTAQAILAEEAGEVAHAVLEKDDENLKEELIQVAAVAVAWLEAILGAELASAVR